MHIIMYEYSLNGECSLCECYASVKQVRMCVLPYSNFQSSHFSILCLQITPIVQWK